MRHHIQILQVPEIRRRRAGGVWGEGHGTGSSRKNETASDSIGHHTHTSITYIQKRAATRTDGRGNEPPYYTNLDATNHELKHEATRHGTTKKTESLY